MNKGFFPLVIAFYLATSLMTAASAATQWFIEPAINIGDRTAEFEWSIAGNIFGSNPNTVSELTWRNLKIREFKASVVATWNNNLVLRGYWNDGNIHGGENQDSDYAFDNRQGEFSRSNNDANSGSTHDNGIGIGIPLQFPLNDAWRLTVFPMIGFSYHEQNLRMKNGVQTVSDTALALSEGFIKPGESIPPVGYQLSGLNSTYNTEWNDSWFGADLSWEWGDKTRFTTNVEFHIADYSANADWNLRDDLTHPVSFEHWANGTGLVVVLGWETQVYKQMSLGVNLDWQKWSTDSGVARFYDYNATTGAVRAIDTQFNGAEWRSSAILFHAGFQFNSL